MSDPVTSAGPTSKSCGGGCCKPVVDEPPVPVPSPAGGCCAKPAAGTGDVCCSAPPLVGDCHSPRVPPTKLDSRCSSDKTSMPSCDSSCCGEKSSPVADTLPGISSIVPFLPSKSATKKCSPLSCHKIVDSEKCSHSDYEHGSIGEQETQRKYRYDRDHDSSRSPTPKVPLTCSDQVATKSSSRCRAWIVPRVLPALCVP
jgi:hypothetical protein